MGKPITNITQNEDGTIDFDFMGGSADNVITGIQQATMGQNDAVHKGVYSLDGRYLGTTLNGLSKGVYIVNGKKMVK